MNLQLNEELKMEKGEREVRQSGRVRIRNYELGFLTLGWFRNLENNFRKLFLNFFYQKMKRIENIHFD